ncbi:helix-turn-helix domain-containing protein [Streptomyces stelliscabiei]|uniref:helix-turn-helix domain-containing protein n=1 Tax=Streptomyces stelliscabiei TaxID=146820 RepID=UPI00099D2114|nr:helix-turn-helix transcriptional regulator [Streptomyces stelliscabiei]MDX2514514.1 helix-turn-helix transcriptional regulator [Streptomyces stelliscabiei]
MSNDAGHRFPLALAVDEDTRRIPIRAGATAVETRGRESSPSPSSATDTAERHARLCRWCRRPLSRYNNEPYCSACSRHVSATPSPPPQVVPEVWKRVDVREALWARDFGRVCHLVRIGSSLRQSDMAELTGLSQAFLSMLESGVRRLTNIDKIVELLAGLNTPAELTGPMLQPSTAAGRPCDPSLTGKKAGWPA